MKRPSLYRRADHNTAPRDCLSAGMTLIEVLMAIAIIGVIVTQFSETLFQFARLKEHGRSDAMDNLSGPQMIAEIYEVLLRIRPCDNPVTSVDRTQFVAIGSDRSVSEADQPNRISGLLYGNSEELCVAAADASGETTQWVEFCTAEIANSGACLLSKLSGLRTSVGRGLLQEPVLLETRQMQSTSAVSGSLVEVRIRRLCHSPLQLSFEFSDGINWLTAWDSSVTQTLPKAIRVTIRSRSSAKKSAVLTRYVSTLLLENPDIE